MCLTGVRPANSTTGYAAKSMGKRELLLIVGFVLAGTVLYQAMAPPSGPNDRGLSLSRLLDRARREIRGNRAAADLARTTIYPVAPDVTELRLSGVTELQVTGEDREDVEADLRVHSMAYDEAEARRFAEETRLKEDRPAGSLALSVSYPEGRQSGRQRTSLTLKIPARLRVRVEGSASKLGVTGVEAVELLNIRGETTVTNTAGRVAINHRNGQVVVDGAAAVKLTGRNSEVTLGRVRGDLSIVMEGGGRLQASAPPGAVDVESRNAEITLQDLSATRGPIRVNAVGGALTLEGVGAETRIDGRNTRIAVALSAAAPVVIDSEGADVVLTPPGAGYRLDAVAVEGRIDPEAAKALGLERSTADEDREQRASGDVNGGGPTISVRTRRSDVVLRSAKEEGPVDSTPRGR